MEQQWVGRRVAREGWRLVNLSPFFLRGLLVYIVSPLHLEDMSIWGLHGEGLRTCQSCADLQGCLRRWESRDMRMEVTLTPFDILVRRRKE